MYINTFKYAPKDVSCQLCTEYVKKLGCTALRCPWLAERIEAGVVGYRRAAEAAKASPGAVGKAAGAGTPCAGAVRHRPAGTVQAELERKAAGYAVCRGGRPNRLTALRKGLKQYGCISR